MRERLASAIDGSNDEEAEVMNNIARLRTSLSPARKRKIASRAATIIAKERSLQERRRAHKLTQRKMAEALGIGQDSVSQRDVLPPAWAHDLRRTVTTHLGELGIAPHIIKAVLNHTDGSITAVYNRFKYDAEKEAALEQWAERVLTIAEAREPSAAPVGSGLRAP